LRHGLDLVADLIGCGNHSQQRCDDRGRIKVIAMSRNTSADSLKLNSGTGQALVEFTLVFLLFLVVAWIPADFGLAFYTGQLAQNASREGARIAAAD
jgi:hypothetical protein